MTTITIHRDRELRHRHHAANFLGAPAGIKRAARRSIRAAERVTVANAYAEYLAERAEGMA